MIFIIIATILSSIWLSTGSNQQKNPNIDPLFVPFYNDLYFDIANQIDSTRLIKLQNLSIKKISAADDDILRKYFGDRSLLMKKNAMGFCIYPENTIYIREISLSNQSQDKIQAMIDHEAGHCVFGRNHSFGYITRNNKLIPKSVMVPGLLNNYIENKDFYRKELITHKLDQIQELNQKEQELRKSGIPAESIPTELKKYEILLDQ